MIAEDRMDPIPVWRFRGGDDGAWLAWAHREATAEAYSQRRERGFCLEFMPLRLLHE
jgi:hypothetical protein